MSVTNLPYVTYALYGLITGVFTWLPVSLNGRFVDAICTLCGGSTISLVPAYLGVMMAPVFLYWTWIAREVTNALRGEFKTVQKFLFYAGLFTLMIGYPLINRGLSLSPSTADILSAGIGGLIILIGLFGRTRDESSDKSALIGAIFGGGAQGVSFIKGISRSGLIFPALLASGFSVRKSLELSFLIAPLFFIIKLIFTGTYSGGNAGQSFTMFVFAFSSSIVVMKGLLILADKLSRKSFAVLYGGIAILACILGVIL